MEVCLEVNEENTKYMCMAYEQNAEQSHIMYMVKKSLKMWQSPDIWECYKQIKTVFRRKWRAD